MKPLLALTTLFAAACLIATFSAQTAPSTAPAPRGKLIFQDTFDNLDNWTPEGPFKPEIVDGAMHLKTVYEPAKNGQYVWCKKELPADFRIEFDVTPLKGTGEKGFFLIFFCQQGVKGEDILGDELFKNYLPADKWKADEDFDKYVSAENRKTHHQSRIRGYHTSYLRGESATCNLRKNPGLNLLKQTKLDEKLPIGKQAHVVLTKVGGHIRLEVSRFEGMVDYVDSKQQRVYVPKMSEPVIFMDHTDEKDVYSGGRFGFRQVYEAEGSYDNFKIHDLTKP